MTIADDPIPAIAPPPPGLGQRTVAAAGWVATAQVAQQLLQFVAAVIVTRLLAPTEYGLLGMVLVFTGYAALLKELNSASALIQREKLEPRHTSSAFWLGMGISVLLTMIMIGAAPLVARFYDEPKVTMLTIVIALNFPLVQMGSIQRALLQRDLQFRSLSIADVLGVAVGGVTSIALAVAGAGVWALVAQILVSSTVTSVALWPMSTWRPTLQLERAALRELFGFTGGLVGSSFLAYTSRNIDNLLIGRFLSTRSLGIYARAYSLMMFPLSRMVSVLGNVMFPSLSRLQGDPARVRSAYLRTISVISLITFPLMLGLAVVADDFVLAVFGPRWLDMVTVLRILAVLGLVQSIGTTTGWIYLSQGRTGMQLRWSLVAAPFVIGGIAVGVAIGSVEAVAAGYAVANALFLYPMFAVPGRLIGMSVGDVARALAPTLACSLLMAGVALLVDLLLPSSIGPTPRLAAMVAIAGVTYLALLHLLRVSAFRELLSIARQRRTKTAAAR